MALTTPKPGTRPTTDRTKEAIFSHLDSWGVLDDARVLDLFAGTGALGIEALSRGARELVAVESAAPAAALIAKTLTALKHNRSWEPGMSARVVKARAENGLNACIAESKAEYRALPKSQKTQTRKLMIVLSKSSELNALQASCDKEMDSIVSQMRTILQENGQSTALADQVMETYKAEKSARYTELKNKFYS